MFFQFYYYCIKSLVVDELEIAILLKKGESEIQDFKLEITSSQKIAKTIVAFANTFGGRLWIGVKDSGKVNGCDTLEERYMIEQAIAEYTKPCPHVEYEVHNFEDKEILVVKIPQGKNRPYYAKDENGKWIAYIRYKDNTIHAGTVTLESFKKIKKDILIKYNEIERNILVFISENPLCNLNTIVKEVSKPRFLIIKILSNLVATKIVKTVYRNNKEYFEIEEIN